MIERSKTQILEDTTTTAAVKVSPRRWPHADWSAILAGTVMVIVIEMVLGLLGAGLGLSTIGPEDNNLKALGIGAFIWWTISGLIALYFGGWIAGRLAGIPRTLDGMLHGLLTWGVSTVILFLLLTTSIGIVIGGSLNLFKAGGQAIAQAAPAVSETIKSVVPTDAIDSIRQDVRGLLDERGRPGVTGNNQTQSPGEAQILAAMGALAVTSSDNSQARREDAINAIVNNTNLSREEAASTIDGWAQRLQATKQNIGQNLDNVKREAIDTAQAASKTAGKGAFASFVMLFLGGVVAAWGGSVGAPQWIEKVKRSM
jgi:hypothetical protein